VIFSLEGFAFVLIGLQLPQIFDAISARNPAQLLGLSVLISVTVIVARILWVYPATYLPRLIPSIRAADPPPPWKVPFVVGWSGMRGAVSLAAALALPRDFPERDLIVFLAFVVILVTLVGQGLTLPLVLRLAGVAGADSRDEREESVARQAASEAALAEIGALRERWPEHLPLIDQLEAMYSHRTEHLPGAHEEHSGDEEDEHEKERREHVAIREAVLRAERDAVIELRDQGVINDEVLRRILREIDLEELRMEA
jgi:CPA1 family monovalent cation:H+ antiporter